MSTWGLAFLTGGYIFMNVSLRDDRESSERRKIPQPERSHMEDHICSYCEEIVNTETDRYVVLSNKEAVAEDRWEYAHSDCYRQAQEQQRTQRQAQ
jgi:hypothetical protein